MERLGRGAARCWGWLPGPELTRVLGGYRWGCCPPSSARHPALPSVLLFPQVVLPPACFRNSFGEHYDLDVRRNKMQWYITPLDALLDTDEIVKIWDGKGITVHRVRAEPLGRGRGEWSGEPGWAMRLFREGVCRGSAGLGLDGSPCPPGNPRGLPGGTSSGHATRKRPAPPGLAPAGAVHPNAHPLQPHLLMHSPGSAADACAFDRPSSLVLGFSRHAAHVQSPFAVLFAPAAAAPRLLPMHAPAVP